MLPTLRILPACVRDRYSRCARPVTFVALAIATVIAMPSVATAQRQKAVGIGTGPVFGPSTSATVLTQHNNNQRTGASASETAFIPSGTSANLNSQVFGKIWSRPLDGTVYAQPLFVPSVQFPNVADVLNATTKNGVFNAVFVCTTHNSVYAFDAGQSAQITRPSSTSTAVRSLPLWKVSFNFPNAHVGPVQLSDIDSEELQPEIGIIGTPVIDMQIDPKTGYRTGTLYVVAKTSEGNEYAQRLHALDIATGRERTEIGSPALIQASVPGNGDGSTGTFANPFVPFDPLWENQQAALTLINGGTNSARVVVAWGSHGNNGPFHGWVMGFNANNLQQAPSVFNTSPNGSSGFFFPAGAGIWQGGAGPAVDENGNLLLATGVGEFNASGQLLGGGTEYGNSVLKLLLPSTPNGVGSVLDFFTPYNWQGLSESFTDLGSAGVVVLPDVGNTLAPHMAASAGEEGTIYLINRDTGSMGKFDTMMDNVVQSIPNAVGPIFGLPAFFNNKLYYQGTGDVLKAFSFLPNGLLNEVPTSRSSRILEFPGATPVVTSSPDGSNGIVWTAERFTPPSILPPFFGIPERTPVGVLHAYNAADVSKELFSGITMGNRDVSTSAVYSVPTIVNSRAYIGGVNELAMFGYFDTNGVIAGSNQADHFVITGPNQVAQNTGNWYSITAVGIDGNPIKLNGAVHLSARTFGGPTVNISTLNFNGQSNLLFQYAFRNSSVYEFFANDDFGHSTYVPDIDQMPFGTLFPEIFVQLPDPGGPDHLIVKAPASAKVGTQVVVTVTTVTPTNGAYTWHSLGENFFINGLSAQFTLPNGTQGAIPGFPVYAYDLNQPQVPFQFGSSKATVKITMPSVGNHVLIVQGSVSYFYGTDPANPTTIISYPLTGTATVVGTP